LFFFFQAEDGIRDFHVTGVQTCALPISFDADGPEGRAALEERRGPRRRLPRLGWITARVHLDEDGLHDAAPPGALVERDRRIPRSEERRVGKEREQRQTQ